MSSSAAAIGSESSQRLATLRITPTGWTVLAFAAVCLALIFREGISYLWQLWGLKEEYSYAYLIPIIAAFLVWQRHDALQRLPFPGSWAGVVITLFGLALFALGELAALFIVVQYALLLTLFGVVLAYTGWRSMRYLWVALVLLAFMIPLPDFLYIQISQKLQLISSQLGVWVVRLFGISVYLEGNVIDLGDFKLQVVEACSGLRYLFPLLTLGFVCALFFRAVLWQRVLLVLSAIPITVLMNSLRIGIIGVLVDRFGPAQAQGFLHDFEGWFIFMVCFALLFAEMYLMGRLSGRQNFREIFAVELPPRVGAQHNAPRPVPAAGWAAVSILAAATVPAMLLPQRVEIPPTRTEFTRFPLQLGDWQGRREYLESEYIDALKFTDYVLADYARPRQAPVNFYVSYYESQRKGESAHSPKVCLPGGGWQIEDFRDHEIPGLSSGNRPFVVNRAVMIHGNDREVVYYWFQQRGRIITGEYAVKWYLLWDALTRNRSDGAMVRLIAPVAPGGSEANADAALQEFARTLAPALTPYIPG
jgi:exosortase D (VPLPA-CTERM-specific)